MSHCPAPTGFEPSPADYANHGIILPTGDASARGRAIHDAIEQQAKPLLSGLVPVAEYLKQEQRDETMPDGRWSFDESVTAVFDDMLQRSIPQYEAMRDAVTSLAAYFLRNATSGQPARLIDLGSSRGEAVRPILDKIGARARYTLTEVSPPMLDALHASFDGWAKAGIVRVQELDLRHEFPIEPPADVVLSVLTLLFVPIEFRHAIVRSAYDALKPGGSMIVVEKVLGDSAQIADLQRANYHALKYANGYTTEQVEAKRASMEGVQVCLTDEWNRDVLRSAGFDQVDCFWRWMNFAGYVAVKS